MQWIMIEKRFCGSPNSANGGYVYGLLARHIDASAEITLRAPPPLGHRLGFVASADCSSEPRFGSRLCENARGAAAPLNGVFKHQLFIPSRVRLASRRPPMRRRRNLDNSGGGD